MIGLFLLTLRELRARKVVLGLAAVATIIWIGFAFALQLDVVDGTLAGARIFGQDMFEDSAGPSADPDAPVLDDDGNPMVNRDGTVRTYGDQLEFGGSFLEEMVFGAQVFVAGAAYWLGIVLALFATGTLVAALTERGQVDTLLTKPLSRSSVLAGRLLGVAAVTLALVAYLIGAVWLVMSLKTGIWNPRFLLSILVIFAMFTVIYSIVTLVGVWSGSGPLSLIVTLGVTFISLILGIDTLPEAVSAAWRPVVEGGYLLLPKFGDVGSDVVPQLATGRPVGGLYPLASSLAFGAVLYAASFLLFTRKDF